MGAGAALPALVTGSVLTLAAGGAERPAWEGVSTGLVGALGVARLPAADTTGVPLPAAALPTGAGMAAPAAAGWAVSAAQPLHNSRHDTTVDATGQAFVRIIKPSTTYSQSEYDAYEGRRFATAI
jgi:hypothetical protein